MKKKIKVTDAEKKTYGEKEEIGFKKPRPEDKERQEDEGNKRSSTVVVEPPRQTERVRPTPDATPGTD